MRTNVKKLTRITVIDHRSGIKSRGRVYEVWDCKLTLDVQDEGRTLKIFINDIESKARQKQ